MSVCFFSILPQPTRVVSISSIENGIQNFRHICTGALINPDVVLTAAHCIHELDLRNLMVIVGLDDYTKATKANMYSVVAYSNPGFRYQGYTAVNDIALLFLANCAKNESITFPKLATGEKLEESTCSPVQPLGYGKNEQIPNQFYTSNGKLRTFSSPQKTHSREVCLSAFINHSINTVLKDEAITQTTTDLLRHSIPESVGCYGGDSSEPGYPCDGDSGGPVINKDTNTLIGVTSFSSEICGTMPNYYTQVGKYASWIKSEIARKKRIICSKDFKSIDTIFNGKVDDPLVERIKTRKLVSLIVAPGAIVDILMNVTKSSCNVQYNRLNDLLIRPEIAPSNIRMTCAGFLKCIDNFSKNIGYKDMANVLLETYPTSINEIADISIDDDEKKAMSRLLLCTSEYELFYQNIYDETFINQSYFATVGECRIVIP